MLEDCKETRITTTCRRIIKQLFPLPSDRQCTRASKITMKQLKAIRGD